LVPHPAPVKGCDEGSGRKPLSITGIVLRSPKVAKPQVEAAFDAFTRACNPLFTVHASDIVKIRASAGEPYGQFRVDQWGWGGEVQSP
jgi:hypothetical protein